MGRPAGPPENDSPRTGGTLLASAPDAREIVDEGDFHLELRNRQATVRGRTLRLSAAEFDVLVYLLSHRRRLITSHTRLATRSADHEVRQAAFLPALLSLRKKLNEQAPGVPYINTEAWMLFEFHPSMGGR
jgi:DNA-binding response OmpR family regulator